MLLYRYEFVKDDYRIGILAGLDDFFTPNEILSCCWVFERDLDCPTFDMCNTKSFFTEKGNRKFRKGIRKIQKLAESRGIIFETTIKDSKDVSDVLYSDNYQVVILE